MTHARSRLWFTLAKFILMRSVLSAKRREYVLLFGCLRWCKQHPTHTNTHTHTHTITHTHTHTPPRRGGRACVWESCWVFYGSNNRRRKTHWERKINLTRGGFRCDCAISPGTGGRLEGELNWKLEKEKGREGLKKGNRKKKKREKWRGGGEGSR